MNNKTNEWDKYWSGVGNNGAFSDGGVNHPAINGFWLHYFQEQSQQTNVSDVFNVVDIASGNGALSELVSNVIPSNQLSLTSVDLSESAIAQLTQRFPFVKGIVADATDIPLGEGTADLVISQFGAEYAGEKAIEEACRIAKSDGTLLLMMHCENGSIYQESETNRTVLKRIADSKLVPTAKQFFHLRSVMKSAEEKAEFDLVAKAFNTAIGELENIMTENGKDAAAGFVFKLYNDLATIHEEFTRYNPEEVIAWLDTMQGEIAAYQRRMEAMLHAALSAKQFEEMKEIIENRGFGISVADKLYSPNDNRPLAWVLVATRRC